VFYVNVPVGVVATTLLIRYFHERIERRRHRLDWAGTLSLSAGIALLLVAVTEVGTTAGWSSPAFLGLLALAAALLVAFVRIERRAAEPVIDLDLVRRPLLSATLTLQILAGVLLFGVQSYVPPMVQGVQGGTAVAAGAAVATMSIGWPLASIVTGRWLVRSTSRPPILLGTACLLAGSLLLTQIARIDWLPYAMLASAVVGSGLGFLNTAIIVTLQSSVQWQQRGVVTGLVQFSRTIGGAVGVGLLGGILSAVVGPRASEILDPLRRADVPQREFEALAASLTAGLVGIYILLAVVAVIAVIVAWRRAPAVAVTASRARPSAEPPS
jgi:MFS family permease